MAFVPISLPENQSAKTAHKSLLVNNILSLGQFFSWGGIFLAQIPVKTQETIVNRTERYESEICFNYG